MITTTKPKLALVVQRCGVEVNGGAEQYCLATAKLLRDVAEVCVLTTCALDYVTWANHYPPGRDDSTGVSILRFPVDRPRVTSSFDELSTGLMQTANPSLEQQEAWMRAQGPMSSGLLDWIDEHRADFDQFVFFGYLYATTYFGLALVREKAVLIPFAHDEWPMRLSMMAKTFAGARQLIFNSEEERRFVGDRFNGLASDGPIVGMHVQVPQDVQAERFRQRYTVFGRFILYVGRIDTSKGVQELSNAFEHYRQQTGDTEVELVLAGRAAMDLAPLPNQRLLGFVDDTSKWDAMAASDFLVLPSAYESLSLVCLEAWAMKKAMVVNAASHVLVGQCRRSQAGLWYESEEECLAQLCVLLNSGQLRSALGARGREFVDANYTRAAVKRRLVTALAGDRG